jgi:hypothetical protein
MSLIRVAGGPPDAQTDPETGARTYQWRGTQLPSVTTILHLAGVPERLHAWALSRVVDRAIEQAQVTAERLRESPDREAAIRQTRAVLLQAALDRRDRAAALGTAIHAGIASGGTTEGPSLDVVSRLRQYNDWLRVSDAEVLASEFQVWNLTLGYAGTADLLIRLRDGSPWLVDIKTGRSIQPNHALQLGAYAMAEFVGADGEPDDRLTELLRQTRNLAVLHLSAGSWEFRSIPSPMTCAMRLPASCATSPGMQWQPRRPCTWGPGDQAPHRPQSALLTSAIPHRPHRLPRRSIASCAHLNRL